MGVIASQYHQLRLSAFDAGPAKMGLRSITLECYSVRPLPVTVASLARRLLLRVQMGCFFSVNTHVAVEVVLGLQNPTGMIIPEHLDPFTCKAGCLL